MGEERGTTESRDMLERDLSRDGGQLFHSRQEGLRLYG